MRKQKRWIALFLTVTLVSGVTGCSTGKENATGGTLPIEKGTALADVFDSEEYAVEEAEEEEIPVSTYEGLTFIKPGTLQQAVILFQRVLPLPRKKQQTDIHRKKQLRSIVRLWKQAV